MAEKPFDLTHSSRFLYLGDEHKEALAMLTYGVMEQKGFVLLTGEVGTGKTTILRAMLNDLDTSVKYVHLANPLLSRREFTNYLTLSAFRSRVTFKSKAEFLLAFEAFLTKCSQHQRHFLLVIDEAHKLSYDLLEEIRLLSNMETTDEKLINIFLVGQPELNKKLNDPRCRALLQRISVRYHLKPLSSKETEEYLTKRLMVAGAHKANDIFPLPVRRAIHEYSEGVPRMINVLSDNLLLLGYAKGQRKLTPAMVRECYEDIQLPDPTPAAVPEPEPMTVTKNFEPGQSSYSGFWKWAFITLLAVLVAGAAVYFREEIESRVRKLVTRSSEPASVLSIDKKTVNASKTAAPAVLLPGNKEVEPHEITTTESRLAGEAQKKTEETASSSTLDPFIPSHEEGAELVFGQPNTGNFGRTIIVQDGDTLDGLAKRIYGRSDEKIWEIVQKRNPDLRDVDFLRPGQKLFFPTMSEMQE